MASPRKNHMSLIKTYRYSVYETVRHTQPILIYYILEYSINLHSYYIAHVTLGNKGQNIDYKLCAKIFYMEAQATSSHKRYSDSKLPTQPHLNSQTVKGL